IVEQIDGSLASVLIIHDLSSIYILPLCSTLLHLQIEFSSSKMGQVSFECGEAQKFSYQSLQLATNNFSDHNLIEKVSFAEVYRGVLPNGTLIVSEHVSNGSLRELLDIKASNILFDSNFTPKIIDFDDAKFVSKFHGLPLEEEDDLVVRFREATLHRFFI
ncbi:hypothetical protein V2J09_007036, partial [Rumex salicifolius]